MKLAIALLMLVFVAGCTAPLYQQQLPEQKPAQPQATPAQQVATSTAQSLDVKISFVELPDNIKVGSSFAVKWSVESNQQKKISHTAVHYGYESKPSEFSLETTPQLAGYAELTSEFASGEYAIPATFNATVVPKQSPIYVRAHVIVDGKNYWTLEKRIKDVTEETQQTVIRRTLPP